jgi:hypothetical protein
MRVTRRIEPNDERGISLVITALALVAIFAMVVLVIDAGALLVKRRAMVKAADAAALAAAQSCVRDTGDAEGQADTFASLNATGALSGGIVAGGCTGNYVTVKYTTQQDLYFAPVLGFGNSDDVSAEATAAWGGLGVARPVPFVLIEGTFSSSDCTIPHLADDTECSFWFDNGGGGAAGFGNGLFGSLNLNKWDWKTGCGTKDLPDNRDYAAAGGFPSDLSLNYPDPTWVCAGDGLASNIYDALAENIGEVLSFPVAESSVPSGGGKFNIVGFTQLELVDVIRPNNAGSGFAGTCGPLTRHFAAGDSVDLDTIPGTGCPITVTGQQPDEIGTPIVSNCSQPAGSGDTGGGGSDGGSDGGSGGGGGNPAVPCAGHYSYDSTTHVLTWGAQPLDADVTFSWQVYGDCGPVPAENNSGYCIKVKWVGFHFGNGPLTGKNFGLEGIRLCDLKFAGSCPTSS